LRSIPEGVTDDVRVSRIASNVAVSLSAPGPELDGLAGVRFKGSILDIV
jgi:hypothetical protein